MSTRGRKHDLVVIEGGNNGALDIMPKPPAALPPDLAADWSAIVADLTERKLLTDTMLGAVEMYVTAIGNVRKAQAAIEQHGVLVTGAEGAMKPNPAQGLLWRSQAIVARLAAELGLTPASRSKAAFQTPKEEEDDLFSKMGI